VSLPGGSIETPGKEYLVRTTGRFKDHRDVARTVIRANDRGKPLFVGINVSYFTRNEVR